MNDRSHTMAYEAEIDAVLEEVPRPLAVIEPRALATPMVSPDEAKAAMKQYTELCEAVLDDSDYQEFTERGKRKRFKKKSAVKKLQTFFGVEVRVREWQRDDLGDGHYGFRVIATAQARNGRIVEATGGCSTFETRFDIEPYDNEGDAAFTKRQKKALARAYHDILSTAETRATNRAVMNCVGVGGGEVTADEVQRDGFKASGRAPRNDAREPAKRATPASAPKSGQMASASEAPPAGDNAARNKALAAIHALKADRGIDDAFYGQVLKDLFGDACYDAKGKPSAAMIEDIRDLRKFYGHLNARSEPLPPEPQS